ncbi:MAG TPA: hypothetical protein VNZ01_11360 [Solirubrobacteraceae bacterium]|nr:hypothetical protein [Solirubrobacteraceae bacterium]
MNFRITRHSGFAAPENALDLLWERLDSLHDGAAFVRGRSEIRATWGIDIPIAMERDEREELGRTAILDIVRGACEQAPGLKSDWFAVGARR